MPVWTVPLTQLIIWCDREIKRDCSYVMSLFGVYSRFQVIYSPTIE